MTSLEYFRYVFLDYVFFSTSGLMNDIWMLAKSIIQYIYNIILGFILGFIKLKYCVMIYRYYNKLMPNFHNSGSMIEILHGWFWFSRYPAPSWYLSSFS